MAENVPNKSITAPIDDSTPTGDLDAPGTTVGAFPDLSQDTDDEEVPELMEQAGWTIE